MEKYVKIICVIVIVFAIIMGIVLCAAVSLIHAQSEKLKERESEREAFEEALSEMLEQRSTTTQPLLPLPARPTESLEPIAPEPVDDEERGFYEKIIAECPAEEINVRYFRVGGSFTSSLTNMLVGEECFVYSSNTDVVVVSEKCKMYAVAPGEANVVIGDGDAYLVFACVVQE